MYGLPLSTEVKQQLPKKAIYQKFDLSASQKESFDADVSRMDFVALISPKKVPAIMEGEEVKEIYILNIQLKRKEYDAKNIILLSKLIPQKMVFALEYEEEVQFAIYHTKLITAGWTPIEEARLPLSGLNLDAVWDNIVKSIGHIEVQEGHTLTEQIKADEEQTKLLAQIKMLERKMANEKQPRRKREYFEQIKRLKQSVK